MGGQMSDEREFRVGPFSIGDIIALVGVVIGAVIF